MCRTRGNQVPDVYSSTAQSEPFHKAYHLLHTWGAPINPPPVLPFPHPRVSQSSLSGDLYAGHSPIPTEPGSPIHPHAVSPSMFPKPISLPLRWSPNPIHSHTKATILSSRSVAPCTSHSLLSMPFIPLSTHG